MLQKIWYTLPNGVPKIEEPSNAGTEEVSAKVLELKLLCKYFAGTEEPSAKVLVPKHIILYKRCLQYYVRAVGIVESCTLHL